MALSLRRKPGSHGTVGLDIDSRYLAAVTVDSGHLHRAAAADLKPGLMTEGEVNDPAALGSALKAFFGEHQLPKSVFLGVSNRQIVVRQIELPWLDDQAQRDAAIRFQAAEAVAMPLDEAVVDYQVTGRVEVPDGSARMQVVVVAARRSMIDGFIEAVRAAGLTPEGIDLSGFALLRALDARPAEHSARVYCNVSTVVNLAIAVGDVCVFTRPLTASWTPDEEDVASLLADEVRLSIDSYMGLPGAQPVAEVVLSGPGAHFQGLPEDLGSMLRLPVVAASPLGFLPEAGLPTDDDPSRYTLATGLALGAAA